MSGLRSWFRGSSTHTPSSTTTSTPGTSTPAQPSNLSIASASSVKLATNEAQARKISDMEEAMEAAALVLNDDIDGAEARLRARKDPTAFHMLGLGVTVFMRSILGFEKDVMAEASARIIECENRAWADMKKEQAAAGVGGGGWFSRRSGGTVATVSATSVYPPGTEYAMVHAYAQLMSAVVGVLHETVADGVKGFYKLRKAYLTLDGIMQVEDEAERRRLQSAGCASAAARPSLAVVQMPGSFDEEEFEDVDKSNGKEPSGGDEIVFEDAPQSLSGTHTPATYQGHLGKADTESASRAGTPVQNNEPALVEALSPGFKALAAAQKDTFVASSPVDVFIHSGTIMAYGMMLLMISMVPPALTRLLSIIGFRGDRERGLRLVWKSTAYPNINGAVAGLILLGMYNGLYSFADIVPTDADIDALTEPDEIVGYPKERCAALLAVLRKRFPDSRLWKLEEARMLANTGRLAEAMTALKENGESKMRQVAALNCFELSINSTFLLDWPLVRDSFLRCIELNNWSHALYYYYAGAAELELYRDAFALTAALRTDEAKKPEAEEAARTAEKHKKRAEEIFRKVPDVAGQKKFMSRPMPFEQYAVRKMARWEARAKELGIDLADAIGSSPAVEMIMLWNGSLRMSNELLAQARKYVGWGRVTAPEGVLAKLRTVDEVAIADLSDAYLLRAMKDYGAAREALNKLVKLDRMAFKGPNVDDYVPALAHYEMAVLNWDEGCDPSQFPADPAAVDEYRRKKMNEAQAGLDTVAKWDAFVLDARIGMRVQIGADSIKWLKGKKNWV